MGDREPGLQASGIACPACGSCDLYVYGTKRIGTKIERYRGCNNPKCKRRKIITQESIKVIR